MGSGVNPRTMPRRAAARPGRGIRGTRIPRGMARIVRGFCEFAGTITIVRNSAPFRAIWSADLRVRPGADLGADPGADFIFEMRGIVRGVI